MSFPLPPELVSHILRLAQEDVPLSERVRIRLRFERVCADWYACDNKWRVVSVSDLPQATKLLELLESVEGGAPRERGELDAVEAGEEERGLDILAPDAAQRIRTLHLGFPRTGDAESVFSGIVSRAVTVEEVSLAVFTHRGEEGEFGNLGDAFTDALSGCKKVKRFTVGRTDETLSSSSGFAVSALKRLLQSWPELESLTISNCDIADRSSIPGVLSSSPLLHTLTLRGVGEREIGAFLDELPATVVTLNIDKAQIFLRTIPQLLRSPRALELATQLKCVSLTDGAPFEPTYLRTTRNTQRRGQAEEFVAALANVEEVTLTPIAIKDFASLAKLAKLRRVEVRVGDTAPDGKVEAKEFVELLAGSSSIKWLAVANWIADRWTDEQVCAVEDAATEGDVSLRWV